MCFFSKTHTLCIIVEFYLVGAESWKSEYKRLNWNIPLVQAQRLEGHTHQVLHVSFSHNGEMFATCSKDGYVIVRSSFVL